MKRLLTLSRFVPRWVVLLTDLSINVSSFALSYFIIKQFEFPHILRGHFFYYTALYSTVSLIVFYFMRIHTGIIRYSNLHDAFRIFLAVCITGILYIPTVYFGITKTFHIHSLNIPGVLLINFFISFSSLIMMRIFYKRWFLLCKEIVCRAERIGSGVWFRL